MPSSLRLVDKSNPLANPTTPAEQPAEKAAEQPSTANVYAVVGVDPEVNAYAMAKYSRSALSMKESLAEIDAQRAEKFLNTFYFQYGHRSIADLAHISFAVERLSILAAIEVADESRWDGQERSTRYQQFRKSGWYTPAALRGQERQRFDGAIQHLFGEYEWLSEIAFEYLKTQVPRPAEVKPEAYERTLRARAFDVSRYLLPLATATSLGQIVSARTLEQQIVRLLSSDYPEVRDIGAALKRAASEPAHDLRHQRARHVLEALRREEDRSSVCQSVMADAEALARPVHAAPTLVKYADPSAYMIESRRELTAAAAELMAGVKPEAGAAVDLLDDEPLEIELAATLLYPHSHHAYRQLKVMIEGLPAARREEIIDVGLKHRGKHDELLRPFQAGQTFRFDILMDVGGFRDMHRHRRCVQIHQDYSFAHGFDTPDVVEKSGATSRYCAALDAAKQAAQTFDPRVQQYLMPLAYRKRSLFKMDLAEVAYIAELRTGVGGHISYRTVAWQMYEALRQRHPSIAKHLRVTDPRHPIDLLQR
jgi:thymidylate synthase ThyX